MKLSLSTPFSLIIFGGSGHLARIKIYPALYVLALKKRLPKDYSIVGFARSPMTDKEFRAFVEESVRTGMGSVNEVVLQEFLTHVQYLQGEYTEKKDFEMLAEELSTLEKNQKGCVRLILSIPPSVFADVSKNLCTGGVNRDDIPFRCIVEKPIGDDLKSFEAIQKQLNSSFVDDEIYLLDHYLGKEAVRNVYYLRFANPILERLLKHTLIDHVEISALESAGIEGRAGYFEHTGTFRDMFQSHLLMVASLLTMRLRENEESFRDSLSDALEQFYLPPAVVMDDLVVQGQYAAGTVRGNPVPGYIEEEGVASSSRTNTFAGLKLMTRMSSWQGIPFYFRSGKRLRKKETRISIQFQEPNLVGPGASPNRLDIILQGEAGMKWHLQTKLGGTDPAFRPLILEDPLVCFGDCLPEHALLILEAIHGRKQWFLNFHDVRTAWRLLDPVQAHLDKKKTPLSTYPAGTDGPNEANIWIEKDGKRWFE